MSPDRQEPLTDEQFDHILETAFRGPEDLYPLYTDVYSWDELRCLRITADSMRDAGLGYVLISLKVPQLADDGLPLLAGFQRAHVFGFGVEARRIHEQLSEALVQHMHELIESGVSKENLLPDLIDFSLRGTQELANERNSFRGRIRRFRERF